MTSMSSHALTCEAVAVRGSHRARAAAAHWNSTRCDHPFGGEALGDDELRRSVEAAVDIAPSSTEPGASSTSARKPCASSGIDSSRSPRPRTARPAARSSHRSGPGVRSNRSRRRDRRLVPWSQPRRRLPPPHLLHHPSTHRRLLEVRLQRAGDVVRCRDGPGHDRCTPRAVGDGCLERRPQRALPHHGEDADGEVRRAHVDGLGGVRMAPREVEAVTSSQRQVEPRLTQFVERQRRRLGRSTHRVARALQRIPHAPALRTLELDDEDVVEVVVQLESMGGRRREVGVHLHGMVQRQRQVVGELGEMGIGQLESLQDDGGAIVVQLEHAVRLDHVFDRAMADPGPPAVRAAAAASHRHARGGRRAAGCPR